MRVLKWFGVVFGVALVLLLAAAMVLESKARERLERVWDIAPPPVLVSATPEAMAEGQRLAALLCSDCHAGDFGGTRFFEDPAIGHIDSANLTAGKGGAKRTDREWLLAIRHGIARNGKGLLIMPSADFHALSASDVGAIVAFLKTLPPVDREPRVRKLTFLSHIIFQIGGLGDSLNVERIQHGVAAATVGPAGGLAQGKYLVKVLGCRNCHGEDLGGGKDANPKAPAAPGLVKGSAVAGWSAEQFVSTLKTGVRPDGRPLGEFMPWKTFGAAREDELGSIAAYLRSLPGR